MLNLILLCLILHPDTIPENLVGHTLDFGIESSLSLSYTGFSLNLISTFNSETNTFYFGPRISLASYYIPARGPFGINTGIRHTFLENERLRSYWMIDYQNLYYKPYNPSYRRTVKMNAIHEFSFSYGITFLLRKNILIGQSIGFGKYIERFHDIPENRVIFYNGYTGLIRIFLNYKL
jgi:hypothetical protein